MAVSAMRPRRHPARLRKARHGRPRRPPAAMRFLDDGLVRLAAKHAPASVRQLYYQAIVVGLVPKDEAQYKTISERLVTLRETGRVPWRSIADRTRWQRKPLTWSGIRAAFESVRRFYRRQVWVGLPDRLFVALEKEALSGIVNDVTAEYDVPLLVLRGFSSATFIHDLAEDILAYKREGLRSHVLVLTDLDPSGVVAAENLRERCLRYCGLTDGQRVPEELPDWLSFTSCRLDPWTSRHVRPTVAADED